MKYCKTNLLTVSGWLFITLIVATSAGCQITPSGLRDDEKPSCPQIKVLAEMPSPDGKLKAIVFQYEDHCERFYLETLAIVANNGTQPEFGKIKHAINFGEGLRPQWLGNREMLVRGDRRHPDDDTVSIYSNSGDGSVKSGHSFSFPIGWFDSVKITYEEEKYEHRIEVLSEVERPGGHHPMGYLKAFVFHHTCIRQSTNETVEDNVSVKIDTSLETSVSITPSYGKPNDRYLYKTTPDAKISVKWLSGDTLLIIGSQAEGAKGLGAKEYAGIAILYQQTGSTRYQQAESKR